LLKNKNYYARQAAEEAFVKLATPEDRERIIDMLKDEDEDARKVAREIFVNIATPEDRERIIDMLKDEDEDARKVARVIFVKIVTPEDREMIINMLMDEDKNVQQAAKDAFVKVVTLEDRRDTIIKLFNNENIEIIKEPITLLKISEAGNNEYLLDLLAEQCQGWSEKQLEIFKLLSEVDKRLYCPYYEEEKEEKSLF